MSFGLNCNTTFCQRFTRRRQIEGGNCGNGRGRFFSYPFSQQGPESENGDLLAAGTGQLPRDCRSPPELAFGLDLFVFLVSPGVPGASKFPAGGRPLTVCPA